ARARASRAWCRRLRSRWAVPHALFAGVTEVVSARRHARAAVRRAQPAVLDGLTHAIAAFGARPRAVRIATSDEPIGIDVMAATADFLRQVTTVAVEPRFARVAAEHDEATRAGMKRGHAIEVA